MTFIYMVAGAILLLSLAAIVFTHYLDEKLRREQMRITQHRIGDIYDYRWKTGETSEDDIKWLLETVEYYLKKEQTK